MPLRTDPSSDVQDDLKGFSQNVKWVKLILEWHPGDMFECLHSYTVTLDTVLVWDEGCSVKLTLDTVLGSGNGSFRCCTIACGD